MNFWRLISGVMLVLSLVGCSNHPPNTAVSQGAVERSFGALNEATPLAAIIKARGIQPLDQSSPQPLLKQLAAELDKTDPDRRYRGVTYNLTQTNALDRDWLLQTPNLWNHSSADLPVYPLQCQDCIADFALPVCSTDADCAGGASCRRLAAVSAMPGRVDQRVCVGHSDLVVDRFYKLVAQARHVVDITVLQPPPDGRFVAALRNALTTLARGGKAVTVRLLVGQYPLDGGTSVSALMAELIRDAKAVPNSQLKVHVGAMWSCLGGADCASFSWNHAKIVAVDGKTALVGGHNMWSRDYLIEEPVHDLSAQLRGPAAIDASRFADRLWQFVCDHTGRDGAVQIVSYVGGEDALGTACLSQLPLPAPVPAGAISVLSVGRLGAGITADFANQGDLARDLMLGAARHTIRLVQQDLAFKKGRLDALYPESTLERLADFLLSTQGNVYIVLSNPGSVSRSGFDYSNGVTVGAVAQKIRQVARGRSSLSDTNLDNLLCQRLHMAPLRFGPDATWPGNRPIGNHSKLWMMDDRAFYVGSDNFYPVDLQEFGYIIDDRAAAAELLRSYWTPLWQWSRLAAISGHDAPQCVFAVNRSVQAK